MLPKKSYTFSKTTSVVADIIAKVRAMEILTIKEELVYLMQVKNLSEEAAQKIIENRSKGKEII